MPYKIGGGYLLQWYDELTGQYADTNTEELSNIDAYSLNIEAKNKLINSSWPIENTKDLYFPRLPLDKEYCTNFVKTFRHYFNTSILSVHPDKIIKYLLVYNEKDDKSGFLKSLGYNENNWDILRDSILKGVDFEVAEFSKLTEHGLTIIAKTKIPSIFKTKTYFVDTIWQVDNNLHCRFITMIIGGKKYGI